MKCLCILGVTLDPKLKFETHLCNVVSEAARSLGIVRQAGKLFNCRQAGKLFDCRQAGKLFDELFQGICFV